VHLVRDALPDPDRRAVVVLGVGNAFRGDDAVGLEVARAVGGEEVEAEPTRLMDAWDGAEACVVVDAVRSGAPPGTVHRLDASSEPLPRSLFDASTHHFGLADTVELARALGRLPGRLVVFGVEGARWDAGDAMTPAVAAVVDDVAAAVREEVRRCTSER
jgi:hydrogenase maturation protease